MEKITTKELKGEELRNLLEELKLSLVESDVAYEVAEKLAEELGEKLEGKRIPRRTDVEEIIKDALKNILNKSLASYNADLFSKAKKKCVEGNPLKIVFLGVNGVGKTTTIAKFAYMFKQRGFTPVVAAADTFRAGAQEQLKIHAEKLGVPIVSGKYGADPASIAFDAIRYAESRGFCVVLIDTAGRMHVDRDLVEELRKIVRVVQPDYKILVLDALTGNDALQQARFFDESVGVDMVVLAITPDYGNRIYLWHPWEKGIAPVEPWPYVDVPIYDYLKRLEERGEDPSEYDSIWYYY